MRSNSRPKLIVVLGPTASGKSSLAVNIAKKMEGEIVSADSRQVYKGLDIGSGKVPISYVPPRGAYTKSSIPSAWKARGIPMYKQVPHHLIDIASPRGVFTVARYQRLARRTVKDILRRGKLPIIVGGTGLYIDALLYEQEFPAVKPDLKLRRKLEKIPAPELFMMLRKKDPERARTIDRHNKRRLVRALEIIEVTGKPVPPNPMKTRSRFLEELGIREKDFLKIGVVLPPAKLRQRIHKRLLARMKQGMIAEVKRLHTQGLSWKRLDDLGLEYRYVSRYLRNRESSLRQGYGRHARIENRAEDQRAKAAMIAELEREIWKYARRQMTWWRKDKEIEWISADKGMPMTYFK